MLSVSAISPVVHENKNLNRKGRNHFVGEECCPRTEYSLSDKVKSNQRKGVEHVCNT